MHPLFVLVCSVLRAPSQARETVQKTTGNKALCPPAPGAARFVPPNAYRPGFANVYPMPIIAKDSKDFAARVAVCVNASATDDLSSGSTLQRFMDTDSPAAAIGRTAEEVRADPLHAWLLFIHHAPEGTQGKSYLFWDSDVQQRHNGARLSTALGFENSWLEWMNKKFGRIFRWPETRHGRQTLQSLAGCVNLTP
ncbi:hypothetical protein B0H14DRAFT_3426712 [Mycena olivaceomarginata]|nr:hypothetical protein B0H14DRAFT_3426712 [Mycena olivaceomarginata]